MHERKDAHMLAGTTPGLALKNTHRKSQTKFNIHEYNKYIKYRHIDNISINCIMNMLDVIKFTVPRKCYVVIVNKIVWNGQTFIVCIFYLKLATNICPNST
jgi:hypothetical protein